MQKLLVIMAIAMAVACNNSSVDSDKAITDSSIMRNDTNSKMKADSGTKALTDTSKTSVDTVVKK